VDQRCVSETGLLVQMETLKPDELGNRFTEVERVSFVGSTNEDCHPDALCNLQNLHAVPPYFGDLSILPAIENFNTPLGYYERNGLGSPSYHSCPSMREYPEPAML